ncbi:MAG: helix-turn-helix domain-containing protein [Thermoanaerobacteraceae bacterium]|nr:helix-turn-helix domain-containing protein [Thermoanaerobacteraceae bacterium]
MSERFAPARVPWSTRPSLKSMAEEAGIDFDAFMGALAANKSDTEMAAAFGVPPEVISRLREHFERYGLQSIMGED